MNEKKPSEFDPREHAAPIRGAVKVWRGEIDSPDGFPLRRTGIPGDRLIKAEEWQEGLPLCGARNGV